MKVKLFGDSIILNSTGSTLFFIDPDIPELNTYKSVFSTWPHPIRTRPLSSKQANEQDIFQTRKKMTIEELGYLDPDLYKHRSSDTTRNMNGGTRLALRAQNKCIKIQHLVNLFAKSIQIKFPLHAEEICEIDVQDQDQVPIKLFKRKTLPTSSKTDLAPYKKKSSDCFMEKAKNFCSCLKERWHL